MMTTLTRRIATAACAAALVLATAACNENEVDPMLPSVSQDESTVTTADAVETTTPPVDDVTETSAPPTLSAEEQDEADATAALEHYHRVLDAVAQDEADIEAINAVAIGTAREQWITQFMFYREQGWTQRGGVDLEVLEVTHREDQIELTVCSDVSGVDVVDESGESIVTSDRPSESLVDFLLERDENAEHGWVLVEDVNRDEPCDG
ncbi:hypothetical protein [Ornithinimicrobium murale]|uniref:hypothetical protein n=1 Tax=Ornithinimicrobium murale TaxID=1050153 RepID=UPI000E0CC472|nr:hypothetical protein [Ornithinimicrobium murale]